MQLRSWPFWPSLCHAVPLFRQHIYQEHPNEAPPRLSDLDPDRRVALTTIPLAPPPCSTSPVTRSRIPAGLA